MPEDDNGAAALVAVDRGEAPPRSRPREQSADHYGGQCHGRGQRQPMDRWHGRCCGTLTGCCCGAVARAFAGRVPWTISRDGAAAKVATMHEAWRNRSGRVGRLCSQASGRGRGCRAAGGVAAVRDATGRHQGPPPWSRPRESRRGCCRGRYRRTMARTAAVDGAAWAAIGGAAGRQQEPLPWSRAADRLLPWTVTRDARRGQCRDGGLCQVAAHFWRRTANFSEVTGSQLFGKPADFCRAVANLAGVAGG